jgi:hypothetical protein
VHGALGVVLTSAALPALLQLEEGSAEAMYFYGQGAGEMLSPAFPIMTTIPAPDGLGPLDMSCAPSSQLDLL